jgi:hypothetical protein
MPIVFCSPGAWTRIPLPPIPGVSFMTLTDFNPFRWAGMRHLSPVPPWQVEGVLVSNVPAPIPYGPGDVIEVMSNGWGAFVQYT